MKLERLREITDTGAWRPTVNGLISGSEASVDPGTFGTYWIEAGHRIREQVADDRLLLSFLRRVLERYEGGPMTLYRGENLNRWRDRSIGFAWTSNIETARMFGRGLNAVGDGGVLLRGTFPPAAILHSPNAHSSYLGESQFTVDPAGVDSIEEIEQYPPLRSANGREA